MPHATDIPQDSTTFVAAFQHSDQARSVVRDLVAAGVPTDAMHQLNHTREVAQHRRTLELLHVPDRDIPALLHTVETGGTLLLVAVNAEYTDRIEGIFQRHSAHKQDEALLDETTGEELVAEASPARVQDDDERTAANALGPLGHRKYRPIVGGTGTGGHQSTFASNAEHDRPM